MTSGTATQLTTHMDALRTSGRKALVAYITAGHPDRARSAELLKGLEAAGVDCVELGVPFSDPLADGPVIQRSSQIALEQGMNFDGALQMVRDAALTIPVVLFSYLNPVMNAGPDALQRAADAGVSGILITDLPVGADPEREAWLGASPLAYVRLVAPTTPASRMAEIAESHRVSTLGAECVAAAEHLGAPVYVWSGDDGPGIRAAMVDLGLDYRTITR